MGGCWCGVFRIAWVDVGVVVEWSGYVGRCWAVGVGSWYCVVGADWF